MPFYYTDFIFCSVNVFLIPTTCFLKLLLTYFCNSFCCVFIIITLRNTSTKIKIYINLIINLIHCIKLFMWIKTMHLSELHTNFFFTVHITLFVCLFNMFDCESLSFCRPYFTKLMHHQIAVKVFLPRKMRVSCENCFNTNLFCNFH